MPWMKRRTISELASHAKAQAMLKTEITPIVQASDRNRPNRSATQPKRVQPITWPT